MAKGEGSRAASEVFRPGVVACSVSPNIAMAGDYAICRSEWQRLARLASRNCTSLRIIARRVEFGSARPQVIT